MKRIAILFFTFIFILGIAGCDGAIIGQNEHKSTTPNATSNTTQSQESEYGENENTTADTSKTTSQTYDKLYDNACEKALSGEIAKAKEMFLQIPENYEPKNNNISPSQWIESIDKYYNSKFIGVWQNGSYVIEITQDLYKTSGVFLRYNKEYTSPGGVTVRDSGFVRIEDDGKTATYYNSSASNAENYELIMANDNTIEVYFHGWSGYKMEITLRRR